MNGGMKMGSSYENEKNKNQFRNKNIAEIINSGNSTNHINVCSRSKSNVASEQDIDF